MEKYVEVLDSLMQGRKEKKKKEPTAKEKEAFRNAWLGLVSQDGFPGRAEYFLYQGFAFCGAESFYAYLMQTEDQNAILTALFNGKYYGLDSNVSFRLVTHLLVLMLNGNASQNILAPVIKRLPGTCINKDKKRLGTAEKTLEKYFLAELQTNAALCPLSNIEIKPVFVKEFIELVSSLMDGIEKNGSGKKVVVNNIEKVRQWFRAYESEERASVANDRSCIMPIKLDDELHKSDGQQEAQSSLQNDWYVKEMGPDTPAYLIDLLNKAGRAATILKSEGIQQRAKVEELTQSLASSDEKLRRARQQIAEYQDTIKELHQRLSDAENSIATLSRDVKKKDTEIAERTKLAEILSRDRSKQADETLQKLAYKIKVEYRDFADAQDVPMTCDLGENLRLQIQSIFDILEKGGMKIR